MAETYKTRYGVDWPKEIPDPFIGMLIGKKWRQFRKERGVEFEPQKKLPLKYKGKTLRHFYQPDLFCFGKIIVELKASAAIADVHRAQLLNYLRITGCRLGLLINFGTHPKVSIERFVL